MLRLFGNLKRRLWIAKLKGWDKEKDRENDGLKKIYYYGMDLLNNAWYVKSAISEVNWMHKSIIESMKLEVEQKKRRIEQLEKAKERTKNEKKRLKIEGLISRLKFRVMLLEECLNKEYIMPVYIGKRKNLKMLSRGWLKPETYRRLRNNQVYSRGDKSHGGNRNIRVWYDKKVWRIKVYHPRKKFADENRDPWVYGTLHVPKKYEHLLVEILNKREAYGVRVKLKNGRFYADVTIKLRRLVKVKGNGIVAEDFNSNNAAYAMVKWNGEVVKTGWIRDDRLWFATKNKREWIRGNMIKEVFALAESAGFFLHAREELEMKFRKKKGRKANRKAYSFSSRKLITLHDVRAVKEFKAVVPVNPAYTSEGGKKLVKELGVNVHMGSAVVIAKRALKMFHKWIRNEWARFYKALEKEDKRRKKLSSSGKLSSGKFGAMRMEPLGQPGSLTPGSRALPAHRASRGKVDEGCDSPTRDAVDEGSSTDPEGYTSIPGRGGPPLRSSHPTPDSFPSVTLKWTGRDRNV